MEKERLELLIKTGMSQRQIADEVDCSQTSIKYWLNKHGLKTKHNQHNKQYDDDEKFCPRCETVKPLTEFYKRSNRNDYNGYCKICSNQYSGNRIKWVKSKMIDYKGGKCVDCNLDSKDVHQCVFDFHHLDPKEKDPNWNRIMFQKWDKIEKELDKCVLLCSNCHRTKHAEIEGW
jgi:predicted transcriptional regulator